MGLAISFLTLGLTSCGTEPVEARKSSQLYNTADPDNIYRSVIEVNRDLSKDGQEFRILQFTDVHWNTQTDMYLQKTYMRRIVEKTRPDLLMLTGDNLLNATKQLARGIDDELNAIAEERHKEVLDPANAAKVATGEVSDFHYCYTWGNHDKQGSYNRSWINNLAMRSPWSVYRDPGVWGDEVAGEGNCYIDIVDNYEKDTGTEFATKTSKFDREVDWRVYAIDSHALHNYQGKYGYQSIRPNQLRWIMDESSWLSEKQHEIIPSLQYHHICPWEFADAFYSYNKDKQQNPENPADRYILEGNVIGTIGEARTHWGKKPCGRPIYKDGKIVGKERVPFGTTGNRSIIELPRGENGEKVEVSYFDISKEAGTIGMFVGHDHQNDWVTQYDKMVLGYGVKTGRELYYVHKGCGGDEAQWHSGTETEHTEKGIIPATKNYYGEYPNPAIKTKDNLKGLFRINDKTNVYNLEGKNDEASILEDTKGLDKLITFDHSGGTLVTIKPYKLNSFLDESGSSTHRRGKFDIQSLYIDTMKVKPTVDLDTATAMEQLKGLWLSQKNVDLPKAEVNVERFEGWN